jgi:ABC-2 type transport system ATP-binding protein
MRDYASTGNAVFISSHLLSEMSQMADNVVVIGQGRLIASTSVRGLISGSSHATVFVRSPKLSQLEKALTGKSLEFEKAEGGLKVSGATTDDIGTLAFNAGIPVLELAQNAASLEDAFLELTEGSEEYHSGGKAGGKSS